MWYAKRSMFYVMLVVALLITATTYAANDLHLLPKPQVFTSMRGSFQSSIVKLIDQRNSATSTIYTRRLGLSISDNAKSTLTVSIVPQLKGVTHNMDEAAKLCDNVGMLYEGKIVEYGNPQELCYRYRVENLFRVISNDDEEIYIENNESGRRKAAEMLVHNEIKSIHTVETTLQTIFVKLTGKELENESSSY